MSKPFNRLQTWDFPLYYMAAGGLRRERARSHRCLIFFAPSSVHPDEVAVQFQRPPRCHPIQSNPVQSSPIHPCIHPSISVCHCVSLVRPRSPRSSGGVAGFPRPAHGSLAGAAGLRSLAHLDRAGGRPDRRRRGAGSEAKDRVKRPVTHGLGFSMFFLKWMEDDGSVFHFCFTYLDYLGLLKTHWMSQAVIDSTNF